MAKMDKYCIFLIIVEWWCATVLVITVVTVFIAHFSRVIHSAEIDRLTAL